MILRRIIERRSIRKRLRNKLLDIFVPAFNTGRILSEKEALQASQDLRVTLNAYVQIYPKVFRKQSADELRRMISDGIIQGGQVNSNFLDPEAMIEVIRKL